MEPEQWLTVDETAERLKIHPQTIRRWLKQGQLQGTLLSHYAGWRIRESEVMYVLEHGLRPKERSRTSGPGSWTLDTGYHASAGQRGQRSPAL
jgi:excisionase family DNA binding protein